MIRRRAVCSVSVMFLVASVVAALPQPQPLRSQSAEGVKAEAASLYADAHPYLDAPFPELKKAVHELSGMTPALSEEQIPDLLEKVGAEADELVQRVPDLVSEEAVSQSRYVMPDARGRPAGGEEDESFHYLILTHPGAFGRVVISESRTTRKGKSVDPTAGLPTYQGFLPTWVLFYPVNQVETRFRYLGRQQIDGHSTFVIGFAQLPGSIASRDRPILLQGIAWVDQSDFRIVRLRTDLLAPLAEKKLLKQTANIVFGPVDLAQPNLQLWLPQRVDFDMQANGQFLHEEHKYFDYRLYQATTDRDADRPRPSPGWPVSSASAEPKNKDKERDEARNEAKLYADARPYMDDPPSELRKTVHELAGLTPAPSQEPLPDLLAKTGAKADDLLRKLPDLISDEGISESHYSEAATNGCVGVGCISQGAVATRDELFHYMILTHPAQEGRQVTEYRTARNGKPVGQAAAGAPSFQGFVSTWIIFSSANQAESRFRYLGQQRVNGRTTYVLGFAQTPGSVESPGEIVVNTMSIPMLLQGIAWIDQSDFRIVRLRTDLLAPLPLILVEKQTANILFGPVHIADLATELWLPKAVNLQMEVRGQVVREEHNYSKYRLYQVKSRIVLSPGDEPANR